MKFWANASTGTKIGYIVVALLLAMFVVWLWDLWTGTDVQEITSLILR